MSREAASASRSDPPSVTAGFLVLVLVQIAHSAEEVAFRLYEVFAPARFLSLLVSEDPARGFLLLNVSICLFGLWCYGFRVRRGHPGAAPYLWIWITISLLNGVTHPAVAIARGGYLPGVATAPLLLAVAAWLAWQLLHERSVPALEEAP